MHDYKSDENDATDDYSSDSSSLSVDYLCDDVIDEDIGTRHSAPVTPVMSRSKTISPSGRSLPAQECWKKAVTWDVDINVLPQCSSDHRKDSFHCRVDGDFSKLSNFRVNDRDVAIVPLISSVSKGSSHDSFKHIYLTKLRQNSEKSTTVKLKGCSSTLPRTILPDRPKKFVDDSMDVAQELDAKSAAKSSTFPRDCKSSKSPIPMKATLHRSSSGKYRCFQVLNDAESSVHQIKKSCNVPLENDMETLDLENDEIDNIVSPSVVDNVIHLSYAKIKNRKHVVNTDRKLKEVDINTISSASEKNVEGPNPFGKKPVLVKSPSLSKLKQRQELEQINMGNSNSSVTEGHVIVDRIFRSPVPILDNSRRINVVSRGSSNHAKTNFDSSHSSNRSIVTVSHAQTDSPNYYGTRTEEIARDRPHLPEVLPKKLNHSAAKFSGNNKRTNTSLFDAQHRLTSGTHHNSEKSNEHSSSTYYEDDFESSSSSSVEEEIQDPMNFSISKITRDKLLQKQGQLMREAEQRRAGFNNNNTLKSNSNERQSATHGQHNERMIRKIVSGNQSYSRSSIHLKEHHVDSSSQKHSRSLGNIPAQSQSVQHERLSRPVTLSRSRSMAPLTNKNKGTWKERRDRSLSKNRESKSTRSFSNSSSRFSSSDLMNYKSKPPINNPTESLRVALKCISSDNWMTKVEGLQTIMSLSENHHQMLISDLHSVILAVNNEIKNLRSSVSRVAISCIGLMFLNLKKSMETDLELIAKTLFHKSGENSGFIREDVEKSLITMVDNVSCNKAVFVVVVTGASHRNGAVRKVAAMCLSRLVERMGAKKTLGGAKDLTEKVLPTAAQFIIDGRPATRYYGKRIFYTLMDHPEFDRLLRKYIQANMLRNISNALDLIRAKGVGECPLEATTSARSRLHDPNSRGSNFNKTM